MLMFFHKITLMEKKTLADLLNAMLLRVIAELQPDTACVFRLLPRYSGACMCLFFRLSVCLCLCLCVTFSCERNISRSYTPILMKFSGQVGCGPRTNGLYFGGDLDSFVDPRSHRRRLFLFSLGKNDVSAAASQFIFSDILYSS